MNKLTYLDKRTFLYFNSKLEKDKFNDFLRNSYYKYHDEYYYGNIKPFIEFEKIHPEPIASKIYCLCDAKDKKTMRFLNYSYTKEIKKLLEDNNFLYQYIIEK